MYLSLKMFKFEGETNIWDLGKKEWLDILHSKYFSNATQMTTIKPAGFFFLCPVAIDFPTDPLLPKPGP